MWDDASRVRLEEMGFDLYVPRVLRAASRADQAQPLPRASGPVLARVALLARAENAQARVLLAQVARSLAFARIEIVVAPDAAQIGDAGGLVVFGPVLAREVGASVSAERQKAIEWVAAAELADFGGSVAAKRALWSELKRLARVLAKARG
jgi:DNA polymerase III psi subunit